VSLGSFAVLLFQYSGWAVLLLLAAGLPGFVAETKFSGDAFRLFRWRSPKSACRTIWNRCSRAMTMPKRSGCLRLGAAPAGPLPERIFQRLYAEDKRLALKRDVWGFALGLMATVILYGAYGWVVVAAVAGRISVGQMTLYLLLLRQGQAAVTAALGCRRWPVRRQPVPVDLVRIPRARPLHPVGGTRNAGSAAG
jgi:ATP-binding cassette subfamily B protein